MISISTFGNDKKVHGFLSSVCFCVGVYQWSQEATVESELQEHDAYYMEAKINEHDEKEEDNMFKQ